MADATIKRTQYWNLATHTVRNGATAHGESVVDLEQYLLPLEQARGAALHAWGVASGFGVSAQLGAPGITLAPGVALDRAGRTIVLAAAGVAVVDPALDVTAVEDVPTVPVEQTGVLLDTTGRELAASCFVTVSWREVNGVNALASVPALLHAPWLRIVPVDGFVDSGDQVVLAQVGLDAAGAVTSLVPGVRRVVGTPSGRLELRVPRAAAGGGAAGGGVEDRVVAALSAGADGNVVLSLLGGSAPVAALRIDAPSGDVRLAGRLRIGGQLTVDHDATTASLSVEGSLDVAGDATVAGALSCDSDATISGSLSAGALQVEGTEVHSGGSGAGYSFADRAVGTHVEQPDAGQRWRWYAKGGEALLWSGEDLLKVRSPKLVSASPDGAGFDVFRRMRVRSNGAFSAGVWFHQDRDRGFVGMADDTHVGFFGALGGGWGFAMNTSTANVGIGIGLSDPAARLHVDGFTAIRASGRTNEPSPGGIFGPVHLLPGVGVEASGDIGVRSTGRILAGDFKGDVRISGTLSKGGGGFTIDHPLDPQARYLSHSFVESPEMRNVYVGTAVTGDDGTAVVELPEYFAALNRDVTYQVTPVGSLAQVAVAEPVASNRFVIASEPGGVTVSWLVTGVRQDPWADAHRIVVEEEKADAMVGRLLHPEVRRRPGGAPDDAELAEAAR